MKSMKKRLAKICIIVVIIIISMSFVSCNDDGDFLSKSNVGLVTTGISSNDDTEISSFDVNVNIKYNVILDKAVKGTNPNIIRATRQAIFDYDCNNSKFVHYNYSADYEVYIFKVIQTGEKTWEVRFREKPNGAASYNDRDEYSCVSVEKQASGSFIGSIAQPDEPCIKYGETY
ncbi:MAG: hypothetical protein Q8942_17260 [Bacillota bacterium]|nr:hypothetical protein [Bacillota bacterium]